MMSARHPVGERVFPDRNTVCCVALEIPDRALRNYCAALGLRGDAAGLDALARAITSSPAWPEWLEDAVLVVRPRAHPQFVVVGVFDDGAVARLRGLAGLLSEGCARLRYLAYPAVEDACHDLAAKLRDVVGSEFIRHCRFAAIPRGGNIVLGYVAMALGARREQLACAVKSSVPVVFVDDSALTGLRLSQAFAEAPGLCEMVVATVASHPLLREAVLSQEPRVKHFVSAVDLEGVHYEAARPDWHKNLPGRRFWTGASGFAVFPWGEPDHPFWNSVTQQVEHGWRIVPPELCFKNRPAQPVDYERVIQWQPLGKGTLRPSKRAAFGRFREQVVVCNLDSGHCFGLSQVAGDMWSALVAHGEIEHAAVALAAEYEVEPERLTGDLRTFADEMTALGLLRTAR